MQWGSGTSRGLLRNGHLPTGMKPATIYLVLLKYGMTNKGLISAVMIQSMLLARRNTTL